MKIAVLLSGGVDSSVALRLLQAQGHQVTAFYLKIWLEDELAYLGSCPWQEDLAIAQKVCDQAGVELKIVSLQEAYHKQVVAYAIEAIKEGRTPNPDIMCNSLIKFGAFNDSYGKEYDAIATGHYANVLEKKGNYFLGMTPDAIKDQTYFLARLSQKQLSRIIFPLGSYTKEQVRQLAHDFDLPNKDRKDSQGLCFLGKIKFKEFVKHHVGTQEGPLVEVETGKQLGVHEGFWFYTVGQRQGIGLSHGPWYVVKKDTVTNTVYISNKYYDDTKERESFFIDHCMWSAGTIPEKKDLLVKIRHGEHLAQCQLQETQEGLKVVLQERDQGIAAGQFAVFYDENLCVGSGVIR